MLNKKIIYLSIVVVAILIVLTTLLILKSLKNSQSHADNNTNSTTSYDYQGSYLSAKIPNNQWKIEELLDTAGMDSILKTNSDYKGLTGINISKNNITVMQFRGVDGIGGINTCDKIFKFSDTEDSYVNGYIEFAQEQGFNSPSVENLTNENYTEIKVFNQSVRRITDKLYWDSSSNPNIFNSYCGLSNEVINLNDLYYSVEGTSSKLNTYKVEIVQKLTDKDFKELDELLESLKSEL